jgi:hypothetical protein
MTFLVKRTNITGPLDEQFTPIEVIKQCMTSHGLEPVLERMEDVSDIRYRRKCIQKLMTLGPIMVKDPRRAARYVNSSTLFSSEKVLMESMEHLHAWETNEFTDLDLETQPYGPITEQSPRSLDCTILFRMCKRRGLQTQPSTTCEDMFRMLTFHLSVPNHGLQDFLIDRIQTMTNTDLVNHFFHLLPRSMEGFERREMCAHYLRTRESVSDPLGLYFPHTDHEAVIMAARMFKLNISKSRTPKMEFALLFKEGPESKFFPIDSKLQEDIQKDTYALRLDQRFDPDLPEEVYKVDHIRKMAAEEGWTPEEGSPYEYLQRVHQENTFFAFGKGPMSNVQSFNQELVIDKEDVGSKEPMELVLYGNRKNPSGAIAISWGELIMTFENYREFRNVFTSETDRVLFEPYMIRKLVILAKKPCIDQTVVERRRRLVALVEKINLETRARMKYLESIRGTLQENVSYRNQMGTLLDVLYRLSLAMRSLRSSESLPEMGGGGDVDSETTQWNTTITAIKLHSLLEEVHDWVRDTFLNLPLVIYYPTENKFSTSETSFEGHTIGGRLKIIHEGENTSAMSSCLRLSSNWFLSTVYYYQSYFRYPIHFDITKIAHIG